MIGGMQDHSRDNRTSGEYSQTTGGRLARCQAETGEGGDRPLQGCHGVFLGGILEEVEVALIEHRGRGHVGGPGLGSIVRVWDQDENGNQRESWDGCA